MSSTTEKSFERGNVLMSLGRYEEAIPFLIKAHSQNPQDVNPVLHLSTCFCRIGKIEKALAYAEQGISLVPHFEYGHRSRSIALAKLERFQESLQSAIEAVRLEPEKLSTLGNLAIAYLRVNQPEKAKDNANLLVKLFPEESQSHEKLADISLALEDFDSAEKSYRESIRLNPENSRLHNQLGVVLLEQFQNETGEKRNAKRNEALLYFVDTLKLTPNNSYALNNLKMTLLEPPDIYFWTAFLPFVVLGLVVTPVWSVMVFLFAFWLYRSNLKDFQKQVDTLPAAMRKNLVPNYDKNNFILAPRILFPRLKHYFTNAYFQILITISITICFQIFAKFPADNLLSTLLKIIFIIDLVWLVRSLFRTPSFESKLF
jgi:tetratricopeptide (TPR) repeat protein